ncbi:MAG: adenylyl-sulfate kinase [Ardenticatenaceae bacterium]
MIDQAGWVLWLTGRPASGKTWLAEAVRQRLGRVGVKAVILDSDELRPILTPQATYTEQERARFYQGIVELADLLTRYGTNIIIAATANRRAYRDAARERFGARFAEVFVSCSLQTCRTRDPKGLYAKVETGEITRLPGIGAAYEPPQAAEVTVNTEDNTPQEAAEKIVTAISFLRSPP